jgi:type 1 glutamine amidotransferase
MITLKTWLGALAGALSLMLGASAVCAQAPAPGQAMPDPHAGKKKLLVIADVQTGFHHDSINHAMAVIERMGRESGAYVAFLRTDSQLITRQPIIGTGSRYEGRPVNARNLNYFDAVFMLSSGSGDLSDQQKADLLAFVKEDGKGFIGGHAATIAFYDWPEYGEMIGGFMAGEYRVEPTGVIVQDPDFPGAAALPTTITDQFPYLGAPYVKGDVHTILRLDPSRLTPEQRAKRPDGDFPVAWAKTYGKGRVFVSSLGHVEEIWDDPVLSNFQLEGIKWALGLTDADVIPDSAQ